MQLVSLLAFSEDISNGGSDADIQHAASEAAFNHLGTEAAYQQAEDRFVAIRGLLSARRRLSTEIISLINDLFIEIYCSAVASVFGIIFRTSQVITLLNSELTWDELPTFIAVQYMPEFVDGWLIIVYLSYLGVSWAAVARSFISAP